MDRIEVVSAVPDDALAIAEVHLAAWQAGYCGIVAAEALAAMSVAQWERIWRTTLLEEGPKVFIARVEHQVAGWIAVGPSRDEDAVSDLGELWAINVRAEHWSCGVGRALWNRGGQCLAARGMRAATLWVLDGNHRAIRFYRALGIEDEPAIEGHRLIGGTRYRQFRYRRAVDVDETAAAED